MPLRDHFRLPPATRFSWEEFHGMWPGEIVRQLRTVLPPGYAAGPKVHLGPYFAVDVAAHELDDPPAPVPADASGGPTAAVWAPPRPTLTVETDLPGNDEYEVRIYDTTYGRTLVAAIELVSPGNKDRADKRDAFVGKCAALLRKGVAVSIVDVVTVRHANLYADLLAFVGRPGADPTLGDTPVYAASCRWVERGKRAVLEGWSHPLAVGEPLPTLPLWLTADRAVRLDLEASYEQTYRDLSFD